MRKQVTVYDGPNGLVGARIEPLPEGRWSRLLGESSLCLLLGENRFCVFEINYTGPEDAEVVLQSDSIEIQADCVHAGICTEEEYGELIHAAQTKRRAETRDREMAEYRRLRQKYGDLLTILDEEKPTREA